MEHGAIERLTATPRYAAHLVVEVPEHELDHGGEDGWTPRRVLAYLRDAESLVWRLRLQRILAETEPLLASFDEAAWLASRATTRDRKEELLGDFALQRQATVTLIRGMRRADFARTARAGEERLTADALIERWLSHDTGQIARLERLTGATVSEVMERRFHPPE